jgi:hypothetical protein
MGGGQQSQSGRSSQQGGLSGSDSDLDDSSSNSASDRDMQQGSDKTNRSSGEQSR